VTGFPFSVRCSRRAALEHGVVHGAVVVGAPAQAAQLAAMPGLVQGLLEVEELDARGSTSDARVRSVSTSPPSPYSTV
jgi:hypothetical protein